MFLWKSNQYVNGRIILSVIFNKWYFQTDFNSSTTAVFQIQISTCNACFIYIIFYSAMNKF